MSVGSDDVRILPSLFIPNCLTLFLSSSLTLLIPLFCFPSPLLPNWNSQGQPVIPLQNILSTLLLWLSSTVSKNLLLGRDFMDFILVFLISLIRLLQ